MAFDMVAAHHHHLIVARLESLFNCKVQLTIWLPFLVSIGHLPAAVYDWFAPVLIVVDVLILGHFTLLVLEIGRR